MSDDGKTADSTVMMHEEADLHDEDTVTVTNSSGETSIIVHRHLCKGCEICVEVCPKDVLKMVVVTDRWEGSMVEVVDIEACNACMLCEYQCPDFAIEVYNVKKEAKKKEKKSVG